jgi:adenylate cyclase
LAAAKKALALDDKDPVAYFAAGRVHMMLGQHDDSVAELERAVALNPGFGLAHHGLGCALMLSGRLEEAAEELDTAIRLSPRDPALWGTMSFRSLTCNMLHQYEAATEWGRRAMHEPRSADGGYWPCAVLASALGNLGQLQEARELLDEALRRKPDLSPATQARPVARLPEGDLSDQATGRPRTLSRGASQSRPDDMTAKRSVQESVTGCDPSCGASRCARALSRNGATTLRS